MSLSIEYFRSLRDIHPSAFVYVTSTSSRLPLISLPFVLWPTGSTVVSVQKVIKLQSALERAASPFNFKYVRLAMAHVYR